MNLQPVEVMYLTTIPNTSIIKLKLHIIYCTLDDKIAAWPIGECIWGPLSCNYYLFVSPAHSTSTRAAKQTACMHRIY